MSELLLLAAEWVLPISTAPIRDGVVAVEGTRIAWVGPRRDLPSRFLEARLRTFPRSLILPGWVNAHAHLNLTAALGLIPGTGDRFADWVRQVVRFRESLPPALVRQSIVAGLDLLAHSGTTTVAHVDTLPELEPFLSHPLRSVVFHEALGFPARRASELLAQSDEWLDRAEQSLRESANPRVTLGLAPHAPYSASAPLIQGLARRARERGLPLSIHLSETRAELELLRAGTGQLQEFLAERGAWDPQWRPPGVTPARYLADLGVLEGPGLAVHCNYLEDDDISLLRSGGLRPVWCPGSFLFFGHRDHPAGRLARAGVPLALGTDSLASNAGLTMLREVRLAADARPELPRETWLYAATLGAAEGLGLGAVTGSLEPGKAADLQVLHGIPEETTDPLAPLFKETLRVRSVLVDGAEMKIR